MIILGIDTSVKTASVAVAEYGGEGIKILAVGRSDGTVTHSENLLPMIAREIEACGLAAGDVDCFAVTNGPGSFTGIRIGIATAKGLAFGRGACCAGIPTLDAFKYASEEIIVTCDKYIISPVIDARRGQAYNALYLYDGGACEKITGDRIIMLPDLMDELNAGGMSALPVYFYGDVNEDAIRASGISGERVNVLPFCQGRENIAEAVCRAAAEYADKGMLTDPNGMVPRYLIKTQAEREYGERERI